MNKTTRFPLIVLISAAILLLAGACTRQISAATPVTASAIPTLAILLEGTPTEAAFPNAVATVTAAPSGVPAEGTAIVVATDALPQSANGTPVPPAIGGQPQEAETPLGFTPTPTEYVVNGNLTPVAVTAENATFLGKHVVQNYDSLESIARAYGVDPAAIRAANNLPSDVVTAGQTLVIPAVKWLNVTAGPISIPQFPPMYQNANFSK